jgi:hypothetical protein
MVRGWIFYTETSNATHLPFSIFIIVYRRKKNMSFTTKFRENATPVSMPRCATPADMACIKMAAQLRMSQTESFPRDVSLLPLIEKITRYCRLARRAQAA